jgi:hypothetical protein
MAQELHPVATHHLPAFVTAPGETDALFVFTAVVVVLGIIGIGVFYFRLHALPEHLVHRRQKGQLELVGVLTLIALFTHNHAFWIAALLLALIPVPDFTTPLLSIARSLERLSSASPPVAAAPAPADAARAAADDQRIEPPSARSVAVRRPPPEAEADADAEADTKDDDLPEQRRA